MTDRERRELEAENCSLRLENKTLTALLVRLEERLRLRASANFDEDMADARRIHETLACYRPAVEHGMEPMWTEKELEDSLVWWRAQFSQKALS